MLCWLGSVPQNVPVPSGGCQLDANLAGQQDKEGEEMRISPWEAERGCFRATGRVVAKSGTRRNHAGTPRGNNGARPAASGAAGLL